MSNDDLNIYDVMYTEQFGTFTLQRFEKRSQNRNYAI